MLMPLAVAALLVSGSPDQSTRPPVCRTGEGAGPRLPRGSAAVEAFCSALLRAPVWSVWLRRPSMRADEAD